MSPSPNDGGSTIIGYELWMSNDGTTFSQVSTYIVTSFLMTHTVDSTNDSIIAG